MGRLSNLLVIERAYYFSKEFTGGEMDFLTEIENSAHLSPAPHPDVNLKRNEPRKTVSQENFGWIKVEGNKKEMEIEVRKE